MSAPLNDRVRATRCPKCGNEDLEREDNQADGVQCLECRHHWVEPLASASESLGWREVHAGELEVGWECYVDEIGTSSWTPIVDAAGKEVAFVVWRSKGPFATQPADFEERVRLIAGAPKLLTMLQEIVAADDVAIAELKKLGMASEGEAFEMTQRARALVAKIKGDA